ncbi:putative gdsl-like lipase acylhydrolase domain protein [Botrytis cinerea BcDW1]|uniref:Putative gdsl-like lipase acylhydrolase domain protein n=1 Tax=Botryotinia fuckeliana (strain BcDW1) TaxID=1290391 RepID=M7UAQ3_BOTF1|nr:putative gdsl-like lipase acylhydrolase domain protein [Botrytis cinerea BcDW1]
MKSSMISSIILSLSYVVTATIWQNDQVRITNYPDTKIDLDSSIFADYPPSAPELSYKGRWDSKYVSWWSAPGLKFGFTGEKVAITFGPLTSDTVLVGYRVNGQDWQLTNITTNATHLLVSPESPAIDVGWPINPSTFELRVTNWAYGVQISAVHLSKGERLIKIPKSSRTIEFIGDSLSSGYTATLEGLSSFAYGMGAGLGNTEYSITAYPGVCLVDQLCWGNTRGMFHQWYYTSDTSPRATQIWGDKPELWDFSKQDDADIVVINLGTNDSNGAINVTSSEYVAQYTLLIEGIHAVWPNAQIVLMSLWEGFFAYGNSYAQAQGFASEIYNIYQYFNSEKYLSNPVLYNPRTNSTYSSHQRSAPFVSYFNTTGLMQHNDINPAYHPTDVGHIKVASHLIQYVRMKFGWELYANGPEIFHDTLYWNDIQSY